MVICQPYHWIHIFFVFCLKEIVVNRELILMRLGIIYQVEKILNYPSGSIPAAYPNGMEIKGLQTGHKFTGKGDRVLSHPSGWQNIKPSIRVHSCCGLPLANDMDFKGLPTRHKLKSLVRLTEYRAIHEFHSCCGLPHPKDMDDMNFLGKTE